MFKALYYNLICIYKPAMTFLPCTHLLIMEQIFFFDLEGASAKIFMKGVKMFLFFILIILIILVILLLFRYWE